MKLCEGRIAVVTGAGHAWPRHVGDRRRQPAAVTEPGNAGVGSDADPERTAADADRNLRRLVRRRRILRR